MTSKYTHVFSLSWQQILQDRGTFVFERFRSLFLIVSLYFLWTALLAHQERFLGYNLSQMLTYVLGLSILRALVLTSNNWETAYEINSGRLSNYLLKPISFHGYCAAQELAQKLLFFLSSIVEMGFLIVIFQVPLYVPAHGAAFLWTFLAVSSAMVLYFLMSSCLGLLGFWTAESSGPIFCFDIVLSFAAGAFFPLDVLPKSLQTGLNLLPFPYLVYFPLNIYLERASGPEIARGFGILWFWVIVLFFAVRATWRQGLKQYGAEGG